MRPALLRWILGLLGAALAPACVMSPGLLAPCMAVLEGEIDLPEHWIDQSGDDRRISIVERDGLRLTSRFHADTPMICDHDDQTGRKTTTYDDFWADVYVGDEGGCALTGKINACRYGNPDTDLNGPVWIPFEAKLLEGPRIVGLAGPDEVTGRTVEVEYIALDCEPKPAAAWFDTPDPESIRYRSVHDLETRAVDHTAIDEFDNAVTVLVLPTVHGTVQSSGFSYRHQTIEIVVDDTGNHLLVELRGELSAPTRPYVESGDRVVPDRPVAELGPRPDNPKEFTIHLTARTAEGEPIDPDCVAEPGAGELQRRPAG